MAKISPVSIKYMIHAKFVAEGPLEKPDVIGALFGQTEGLLGADLEMRDLQKEGKIGRIEVFLDRESGKTVGRIEIPTALDQSETTLIGAAIETIERIGPTDAKIEVEKIEDVRGVKRDYIIDRAKQLLERMQGGTISKEISESVKSSARMAKLHEFGEEKLPAGDLSSDEIIVVEGRADVINLLRYGVNNVIGMNGTKLPKAIAELGKEKTLILFVDGDRGGKLIAKNVIDNAEVSFIATAPDGKEVEELSGKEILMTLRRKIPVRSLTGREESMRFSDTERIIPKDETEAPENEEVEEELESDESEEAEEAEETEEIRKLNSGEKDALKKIAKQASGSEKAIIVDQRMNQIGEAPVKRLISVLKHLEEKPFAIIIDGTANASILEVAEEVGCQAIVAKMFSTTDTALNLMSF